MNYLVKNIDQYVDDSRRYQESRSDNKAVKFLGKLMLYFMK